MADRVAARAAPGAGIDFGTRGSGDHSGYRTVFLLVVGAAIFLGSIWSPPSLMDDVDSVNAQIARNMLDSGDWVTAHINGVKYLEKSPLGYWLMASGYAIFGVHDWVARLPNALGAVALMFITAALGRWGFGPQAGFYAGLSVGASVGLFLFTRIVIPDVLLTGAVGCALYSFLRAVEDRESCWIWGFWASIGVGMLLKGLLAALVPIATAFLYLLVERRLLQRETWKLLRPVRGVLLVLAIFAPWVVLATLRNPPLFEFTLRSNPGVYRGFLWFYFINEHILRFLGLRFPKDYNTVPRLPFLLLHLVWFFPWSAFLPAALKTDLSDDPRAARLRRLALLWIGFLLTFLSFSTTQEYYSMPCYPAFGILLGLGLAQGPRGWVQAGYGVLAVIGIAAGAVAGGILYRVHGLPALGDINSVLTQNPDAYTLSLGHMRDLTLASFAYLRGPLLAAGLALSLGTLGAWFLRRSSFAPLCLAAMMVVSLQAAHAAMGVFDPYLSSRPLADALREAPPGQLIIEGHYYPASSVVFYTNRRALLLNGRADNLIYGSAAPDVPPVFLNDADLARMWKQDQPLYLVAPEESRRRLEGLLGAAQVFAARGGKMILTNRP